MRHRTLSLASAVVAILALTSSAFAQAVITETTTGTIPGPAVFDITGRTDQIFGFSQTPGVPPVAPGTFQPKVQATDPTTAASGIPMVSYVSDLDAWMATNFGWRSSTPVTFLLFPDSQSLLSAYGTITGTPATPEQTSTILSRPAFLLNSATNGFDGVNPGEAVILVNMDTDAAMQTYGNLQSQFNVETSTPGSVLPPVSPTVQNATQLIQESMARNYALLMENQISGNTNSTMLKDGLADTIAFRIVPGTPEQAGRPMAVATAQATSIIPVPDVGTLDQNWSSFISTPGITFDVARGLAVLSAESLLSRVSPTTAMEIMRSEANGRPLDVALAFFGGPSLPSLNSATESLIPIP